ncbi:MAG: hypothetical protein IT257_09580 [Chitinophagaceae bacterium]|nr:hypothetical protein [Chitinophagaceae bacterium]
MKKLLLLMMIGFVFFNNIANARPTITVKLTVEIGRPKHNCLKGLWFCNPKIDLEGSMSGRAVRANFTDNGNGTMTINFLSKLPESGANFFADNDEPVSLSRDICSKFGYNSIILVPGSYTFSSNASSGWGSVTVKILTN